MCQSATSQASDLAGTIVASPEWACAKGGAREQKLQSLAKSVKDGLNSWHHEFLMSPDIAVFTKKCTSDRPLVEWSSMLALKSK
eukprot:2266328-Pyramimonas_sp.AAC.1